MFLIVGISPKEKILDENSRICPSCGLAQARLRRVDSYFNLFFIPLFRVKKGTPFIACDRCESVSPETAFREYPRPREPSLRCASCGNPLEEAFKFCPSCGRPVNETRLLDR